MVGIGLCMPVFTPFEFSVLPAQHLSSRFLDFFLMGIRFPYTKMERGYGTYSPPVP